MILNVKTTHYAFQPGGTIEGAIRMFNDMDMDKELLDALVKEFNRINQDALPPRMGQPVKIPIIKK